VKNRGFKILVLIGLVVLMGFLRETLFVRIEWYEKVVLDKADPPPPHWLFGFLEHFSYRQLEISRYVFTLVFVSVFYLLSRLMIRWFFPSSTNIKLVNLIFIGVLFLAGIFTLAGYVTGYKMAWYNIARYALNLIETPLILFLLFPLFWTARKMPQ
jgi:hypothetical protein